MIFKVAWFITADSGLLCTGKFSTQATQDLLFPWMGDSEADLMKTQQNSWWIAAFRGQFRFGALMSE